MDLETKHTGSYGKRPAALIELITTDGNTTITINVTDINERVDKNLIQRFRDLADEFEEQNRKVDEWYAV